MKRLDGKTAIVTGAAQGLGEAISVRLAQEGCTGITLADLQEAKAYAVAQRIEADSPWCKTLVARCDVTSEPDVIALVERHVQTFGKLDIMVANAGILIAHDITEFPAEQWKRVVDVNLYGYFLCAREAAKVMVRQHSGVIIQINSKSGKKGSFRNSAYAASKFGGIGLTQSIALDLAPYGVRVNAICPGNLLDSPLWQDSLYEQYARKWGLTVEQVRRKYEDQVPLGRGCTYDDVTNLLVFLASDEASYITGEAYSVTGGQL